MIRGSPHVDFDKTKKYNHQTQVGLKISSWEQLEVSKKFTSNQPTWELKYSNTLHTLPIPPPTLQYLIAKDKSHRQIKHPQKYGKVGLVA